MMAEEGLQKPDLLDQSPTLKDDQETIRDGEKAPNTDFRKALALDYAKKIKIITREAWKMRDLKSKGLA